MHIGSFNLAKQAVFSHIEPAKFADLTTAQQLETVMDAFAKDATLATDDFSKYDAACFVYIFRAESGLPVTREELGLVEPKGWEKPLPFINIMALVSQWPEEYSKVPAMAAAVDYATVKQEEAICNARIAACVRDVLGMGGLEYSGDSDIVGDTDPIMKLFIEAVKFQLQTVTAPLWFTGGEVANTRSLYEITTLAEAEKQRARIESKRKYAEDRAARIRKEHVDKKAAYFATLNNPTLTTVVEGMNAAGFEVVKGIVKADVWLDEGLKAAAGDNISLMQQYILSELAALQPTWFRETANTDLVIRPAPLKVKPQTMSRSVHAIRLAVTKQITKYGWDKVKVELEGFIKDHAASMISEGEENGNA
jgi:hypothetical protein